MHHFTITGLYKISNLQGLTGLGISLLGAVGGIAHHPLQSVLADGASPRSLVAGVGLGLVGAITKPLSGAADLVALTGQGMDYLLFRLKTSENLILLQDYYKELVGTSYPNHG